MGEDRWAWLLFLGLSTLTAAALVYLLTASGVMSLPSAVVTALALTGITGFAVYRYLRR